MYFPIAGRLIRPLNATLIIQSLQYWSSSIVVENLNLIMPSFGMEMVLEAGEAVSLCRLHTLQQRRGS